MTATYLSKLLPQVNRSRKNHFTAREIAEILTVKIKSANDVLFQLDAELVEIAGVEKVTSMGRPRQIYNLKFPYYQKSQRCVKKIEEPILVPLFFWTRLE